MADLLVTKRVLYFALQAGRLSDLLATLAELRDVEVNPKADPPFFRLERVTVLLYAETDLERALERVHHEYFNLVLVDLCAPTADSAEVHGEQALAFLRALDADEDPATRYAFNRIVALVPGESDQVDCLIAELGTLGIRRVVRRLEDARAFAGRVADTVLATMLERRLRKCALCASGGGITGLYYELGVLKCLDDCLTPGSVNTFDLFFGISAGAVVTGLLAVGYTVDEIMAGIAGHQGGRVDPLNLSILRLRHLNLGDLAKRLGGAGATLWDWWLRFVTGRARPSLRSMFFDYSDLLGPFFRTDGYEAILRELIVAAGGHNDFRKLSRKLLIGATDQDTRRAVLFGSRGWEDIPISTAIQASMSLNPAFGATRVGSRHYEDGAVTRTSNFMEAIRRGADLVFVINPLVPYISKTPGFSHGRGFLYNVDQDIRSMSYTRFEAAREWVLHKHPEVSLYTFLPGNELRRDLSVNPLDHRPYLGIWRGGYLSTLQRILLVQHRLKGDLHNHGFKLSTARAQAVADRLRAVTRPRLADFFPDGKVVLNQTPFSRFPVETVPEPPSVVAEQQRGL